MGQQELQLGLLLNIVNPAIGGILIRGEKGTAKSTAVRGLAALTAGLDGMELPLIELPLNTTEDMLVGSIDFSKALQSGEMALQQGLLSRADGGILYIDEVNLLDDHLVDIILDTAASGVNIVAREGLCHTLAASFILIGTMNPEEGELRPQLLDRFGLCAEVAGLDDIGQRVELLRRQECFDADPAGFIRQWQEESDQQRARLIRAREAVGRFSVSAGQRGFIAELARHNNVAGHRADLVMEQAAIALAALEDAAKVELRHIGRVAPLVLAHRIREAGEPPAEPPSLEPPQPDDHVQQDSEQQHEESPLSPEDPAAGQQEQPPAAEKDSPLQGGDKDADQEQPASGGEFIFAVGEPFTVRSISSDRDRLARRGCGRRSRSRVLQKQGRYIKAADAAAGVAGDIAFDATLRAAAPWQKSRKRQNASSLAIQIRPDDIKTRVRERRLGNLLLFLVDGSGSMGARGRMAASKGAIMSLLLDAYQKRDKVAMVSFRGRCAAVNLPVTGSVELAGRMLTEMPVGGRTPLSAGLVKGWQMVRSTLTRDPAARPIVIILTDGKANVSLGGEKPVAEMERLALVLRQEKRVQYLVVDTEEEGPVSFGLARRLAIGLGAGYFRINDLRAEELVRIVRENQQ